MPSPPLLRKFQSLCFRRVIRERLGTVLAFVDASRSPIEFSSFSCFVHKSSSFHSPSLWTSQSPLSGFRLKPSEDAYTPFKQGELRSATELQSPILATAHGHRPVWQGFSHHSYQMWIDKSHFERFRQPLEWTTAAAIRGISKSSYLTIHDQFHVWAAEAQSLRLTPATCFWKRPEDHWKGFLEDDPQKSSFTAVNQSEFSEEGRKDETRRYRERQPAFGSKLQVGRLLSIPSLVYFYNARLCLQIVSDLFQKAAHVITWGRAAVMPLGLMYNISQLEENSEAKEKFTEGNLDNKGLKLLPGACCLPHPEKEDTGGEDAYFICLDKQAIGVADGVGGWADLGVDAGQYARELMNQSLIAARQERHGFIDPARVLERAHSNTTCKGSSTACILTLSDYGLQAANLGDSGFLVLRDGRVIFKSPVQQHKFNIPYQLGCDGSDLPSAAKVFTVEVVKGDVIVAGTDGLFDNLYDVEVASIVVHAIRSKLNPEITAQKIASLARSHAQDHNRQTPFSTAAQDAGFRFYGGKLDDITVVVSYITAE